MDEFSENLFFYFSTMQDPAELLVQRCFHPVGQGAFYSEEFKFAIKDTPFYIVYDCGTQTSEKRVKIKSVIKEYFPKNAEILFLFVSHFDNDHISGIQYLLEHCSIRFLCLPLISNATKLMYLANNKTQKGGNSFYRELLYDAENTAKEYGSKEGGNLWPQVVYVEASDPESDYLPSTEPFPFDWPSDSYPKNDEPSSEGGPKRKQKIKNVDGKLVIPSGATFTFPSSDTLNQSSVNSEIGFIWCFSPFNYEFRTRSAEFENSIATLNIMPEEWNDLKSLWEKHQNALKTAFNRLKYGKHANNMSLYSGPYEVNDKYTTDSFLLAPGHKVGAIYTGDYEAKTDNMIGQFDKHFRRWKDHLGVLQLPHHGSLANFHEHLLEYSNTFVLSFGLSNLYHHPSPTVINELCKRDKNVFMVHEYSERAIQYLRVVKQ